MGLSFVGTKEQVLPEQILPVEQLGANWVSLMPYGYLNSAQDSIVAYDTDWQWVGEKTKGLNATIPLFKARGIKIMLNKSGSVGVYIRERLILQVNILGKYSKHHIANLFYTLHRLQNNTIFPCTVLGQNCLRWLKEKKSFGGS